MPPSAPLLPRPTDLESYARVRGDPAVWLPALAVICERHGIDGADLYAERTGTNIVFRAGDGPWIKLFPPLWPEDFVRERVGLEAVTGTEGLAVPQLLHEGELEGWHYVVISNVPGRALGEIWIDLEDRQRIELAEQLGALIARLHAIDVAGCAPISADWSAFVTRRVAAVVPRNERAGANSAWLTELGVFATESAPLVSGPIEPVFLHADLTDEHVFVTECGGRWQISGLIDFGDAMIGDPLYEFAAPTAFLCQRRPTAQRALLRGYGFADAEVDDLLIGRLRAWTILHRFSKVSEILPFCPQPRPKNLDEFLDALWSAR